MGSRTAVFGHCLLLLMTTFLVCNGVSVEQRSFRNFQHTHPKLLSPLTRSKYVKSNEYYLDMAKEFVEDQLEKEFNTNVAKNLILFLGDGMSIPTLTATRIYLGGEEKPLSFDEFPFVGMAKTYCHDVQVPDSACTSTCMYIFLIIRNQSKKVCQRRFRFVISSIFSIFEWSESKLWHFGCHWRSETIGMHGSQ